jgi:hypothetical protein
LQNIETAYTNVREFMNAEIAAQKAKVNEQDDDTIVDIFSRLVAANENDHGLSDRELM